MSYFAVIEEGKVINTIVADSVEIAEEVTQKICIEYELIPGAPSIGWTYEGTNFIEPSNEIA